MDEALIREQEQQLQKTGKYYKHICWMAVPPLCMACYLYGLRPLLLCGIAMLTGNLCDRLVSQLRHLPNYILIEFELILHTLSYARDWFRRKLFKK